MSDHSVIPPKDFGETRLGTIRLGVDARCVPSDGVPGGGVAHAARALIDAMETISERFCVEMIVWRAGSGLAVAREAKQARCHALFVPSGAASPFIDIPAFPWVHDLDIFDHSEWFPQSWLRRQWTTRLFLRGLRRAPKIFCVSEYTEQAIERVIGIAREKIVVTSEGFTTTTLHAPRSTLHDHALILGTVEPRKNIPFIIALWPEVCRRLGKIATLVVAGKEGWGNVAIDESLPWLKRLRNVSDEQVDALLSEAECVLVPSLSEGFGRTALEAMARGTPVIVANRGALPEVVGKAGILLDPTDRERWIQHIVELLNSESRRKELGRLGYIRSQNFRWKTVAECILENIRAFC